MGSCSMNCHTCLQVPTQLVMQPEQLEESNHQMNTRQHDEATLAMATQLQPDQAAPQESQAVLLPLPMQVDRQPDEALLPNSDEAEEGEHSHDESGSEQQELNASGQPEAGNAEPAPDLMLEDTQEREPSPSPESSPGEELNPAGGFAQMQNDTYDEFAGIE